MILTVNGHDLFESTAPDGVYEWTGWPPFKYTIYKLNGKLFWLHYHNPKLPPHKKGFMEPVELLNKQSKWKLQREENANTLPPEPKRPELIRPDVTKEAKP